MDQTVQPPTLNGGGCWSNFRLLQDWYVIPGECSGVAGIIFFVNKWALISCNFHLKHSIRQYSFGLQISLQYFKKLILSSWCTPCFISTDPYKIYCSNTAIMREAHCLNLNSLLKRREDWFNKSVGVNNCCLESHHLNSIVCKTF